MAGEPSLWLRFAMPPTDPGQRLPVSLTKLPSMLVYGLCH